MLTAQTDCSSTPLDQVKMFELLDSYPIKRGLFPVVDDLLYTAAFLTHLLGPVVCNAASKGGDM